MLRPVIERLQADGHEVEVTAREYGQTVGLLERLGIEHTVVGEHGGSSAVGKGAALLGRSARLWRWARKRGFDLGLAHGSVDIAVVGKRLGVPTVQMQDYEFAGRQRKISWGAAARVMVPDAIPIERLVEAGADESRLFLYPGLKEDYYLADFAPDPAVLDELGIDSEAVLVVVRPPPETSEYHARNELYDGVLDRIEASEAAIGVVIPRTSEQGRAIARRAGRRLVVPERAIDAQSLIAYADLVVSAGGTMNREAVALGTPVHTIFSGRMGAVDERLIEEGKLRELDAPETLDLSKRTTPTGVVNPRDPQLWVDAVLGARPGVE